MENLLFAPYSTDWSCMGSSSFWHDREKSIKVVSTGLPLAFKNCAFDWTHTWKVGSESLRPAIFFLRPYMLKCRETGYYKMVMIMKFINNNRYQFDQNSMQKVYIFLFALISHRHRIATIRKSEQFTMFPTIHYPCIVSLEEQHVLFDSPADFHILPRGPMYP